MDFNYSIAPQKTRHLNTTKKHAHTLVRTLHTTPLVAVLTTSFAKYGIVQDELHITHGRTNAVRYTHRWKLDSGEISR